MIEDENQEEELYCARCRRVLPATEEFWWRNKHYKSGWNERMCKKCCLEVRKIKIAGKSENFFSERPSIFGEFEIKAMNDMVSRAKIPCISIYKEL